MTSNLTEIPADIQALADQAGVTPEVTVTTITARKRSPANAEKVAILTDLLTVVDEEEVDKYFLGMLGIARDTGINLKGSPVELLQTIERKHQPKPSVVDMNAGGHVDPKPGAGGGDMGTYSTAR